MITLLYVGKNRATKIVNILYYKLGERSHYAYIHNISRLIYNSMKSHNKKFVCLYCACTYFNTQDALTSHIDKKHPYINNKFVCEKCLNIFHTQEAKNSTTQSVWSKRMSRELLSILRTTSQSSGRRKTTSC